jgi:hypothetical protein
MRSRRCKYAQGKEEQASRAHLGSLLQVKATVQIEVQRHALCCQLAVLRRVDHHNGAARYLWQLVEEAAAPAPAAAAKSAAAVAVGRALQA